MRVVKIEHIESIFKETREAFDEILRLGAIDIDVHDNIIDSFNVIEEVLNEASEEV